MRAIEWECLAGARLINGIFVFAALFAVMTPYLLSGKSRDWKTGKVLDAMPYEKFLQASTRSNSTTTGTVSPDYGGGSAVRLQTYGESTTDHELIRDTVILLLGGDYEYVLKDSVVKAVGTEQHLLTRTLANRKRGCRFVVGDALQYSQNKSSVWIKDADGKVCKLDILRQESVISSAK